MAINAKNTAALGGETQVQAVDDRLVTFCSGTPPERATCSRFYKSTGSIEKGHHGEIGPLPQLLELMMNTVGVSYL